MSMFRALAPDLTLWAANPRAMRIVLLDKDGAPQDLTGRGLATFAIRRSKMLEPMVTADAVLSTDGLAWLLLLTADQCSAIYDDSQSYAISYDVIETGDGSTLRWTGRIDAQPASVLPGGAAAPVVVDLPAAELVSETATILISERGAAGFGVEQRLKDLGDIPEADPALMRDKIREWGGEGGAPYAASAEAAMGEAQASAVQTAGDRQATEQARIETVAAASAALAQGPIHPNVATGLALTAEGQQFRYLSADKLNVEVATKTGGVAVPVTDLPTGDYVRRTNDRVDLTDADVAIARARTYTTTTLPRIRRGIRWVDITALSFDLNAVRAQWADTGLPYTFGKSPDTLTVFPETTFQGRPFLPTKVSFDLVMLEGRFLDSGADYPSPLPETTFLGRPFQPDLIDFSLAPVRGTFLDNGALYPSLLPETVFQGRPFQPALISFDFVPYSGMFLDDGTAYPVAGSGGATEVFLWPEMEVKFFAGRIDVYRRQFANVYTRHTIVLTNAPALNSSVWHTREIWEVTRSQAGAYSQVMRIVRPGEVELAIYFQNPDRANAIGGDAHGNEQAVSFAAMLDGVIVDHSVAGTHACSRFELFQRSTGFLPGTSNAYVPQGPAIFDIYKHWVFTPGSQLQLDSYLDPLLAGYQCKVGYPMMAPIERISGIDGATVISSAARRAPKWLPESVALGDAEILDLSDNIKVYGSRYSAEVKVLEGWDNPHRQMRVKLDSADYAKIYANAWQNKITVIGEPWICSATLNVRISEGATA